MIACEGTHTVKDALEDTGEASKDNKWLDEYNLLLDTSKAHLTTMNHTFKQILGRLSKVK